MVHVSRGLVGAELKTITQVIRDKTVCRRLGALAGPLVADALAEGRPSGAILGTGFPELTHMVREALGGAGLRVYETSDVVGVELASATVGLPDRRARLRARAGAGTQHHRGARDAGHGRGVTHRADAWGQGVDVHGPCGPWRPHRGGGGRRAPGAPTRPALWRRGQSSQCAVGEAGAYVEGIEVARHLIEHARRLGLQTPISSTFVAVSEGRMSSDDAIHALMERRVGKE